MSFFDDDDEPIRVTRTRPAAPRAGAGRPASTRVGGGGGGTIDDQTLRQRRLIALVVGLVLLVVLVLVVRACQSSATKDGLRTYNREVSALVTDSKRSVAEPLFTALQAGGDAQDLQVQVNQLRVTAEDQAKRAADLDAPGQVVRAQDDLELTMNLRTSALAGIGAELPSALVSNRDDAQTAEAALSRIAGAMQSLLASDVVYSQRVAPYIRDALSDNGVSGQRIAGSEVRFLTNFGWLDPSQIAGRFGTPRAGGGTGASTTPAPGTHGHGLNSVAVGDTTLQPGGTTNRLTASADLAFAVAFANQGENDETQVKVSVKVAPTTGSAFTVTRTVPTTTAGADATVTIPLGRTPPIGAAEVTVTVEAVPGEEMTDNNTQTYTTIFAR